MALWPLVKARKTFELPSGRLLSFDEDVRSLSREQLVRPLPKDVCCNTYTEFIFDKYPTVDEYDEHVPAMPVRTAMHNPDGHGQPTNGWAHRPRTSGWVTNPVAVARKVPASEIAKNSVARDKMRDEHNKLTDHGVWDLSGVRSWSDVAAEAKRKGTKAHRGNVFGLCFEKGAELPAGHPDRKFKGRYVFQGNVVCDEYQETALFNELGSSPATLEGAKAVDAFGCLPGHRTESADAKQAYTQALLGKHTPGASSGDGGKDSVQSSYRHVGHSAKGGSSSD